MPNTVAETLIGARPKLREVTDSPGTDAQLLLGEVLGRSRAWILAHPEHEMRKSERIQFDLMLREVQEGAALPHVLGWWEFYGRRFKVNPRVLVPRPETELMVETAVRLATPKPNVIDLGTGSGCIAVTLSLEIPGARVLATDISIGALQVAQQNVSNYRVGNVVDLICSDLGSAMLGRFDVVCANLPYIATNHLDSLPVAHREPLQALDGGAEGLELIERSLAALPGLLEADGLALFEFDPDQANTVLERARHFLPSAETWIENDLAGRQRLLVIKHG